MVIFSLYFSFLTKKIFDQIFHVKNSGKKRGWKNRFFLDDQSFGRVKIFFDGKKNVRGTIRLFIFNLYGTSRVR